MKNHIQINQNKSKKGEGITGSRKRMSFSQTEGLNENKKKINVSPQKSSDIKKEKEIINFLLCCKYSTLIIIRVKQEKNIFINQKQNSDSKDNNYKIQSIPKFGINLQANNYIINKKNEDIKDKSDKNKIYENSQNNKEYNNQNNYKDSNNNDLKKTNKTSGINTISITLKDNKIKEIKKETNLKMTPPSNNNNNNKDDNFNNQLKENDKKLRDTLQAYNNINKKGDGSSLNTLFKLRSILINWLKDSDQDLEYTKFMTEKKLKYLMKNKEKSEARIKVLDSEIKALNARKEELEKTLGEIYSFYDEEGLREDIKRFENSNEVKSGKFSKTLEQLETMKKMLPFVIEYGKVKDNRTKKHNEKKELEKIVKSSGQTLVFLSNYYKNIKKKINEQINNNNN